VPNDIDRLGVLICDDNRDTATAISLLISRPGLTVATAFSYEEAVLMLASRPHFLFADMILPRAHTGVELITLTRRHVPDCRCFILTAATDTSVEDEAVAAGIGLSEILYKPIASETLLKLVLVDPDATVPVMREG
jgi:CheY-like chemotaxis protein